ncbi:MAG: hypothetical protein KF805_03805 [Phycisphaeraceae bacterium]|nr:hypothetical protein [Phycisphaeraceae bacterium]
MDQFRNTLATIQKYLGQLTLTHKLLVALVTVIAVMSLLLVWTWSAKQEYTEFLPRATDVEQAKAADWLRNHDVTPMMKGTHPWVPAAQHHALFSRYAEAGNLPQDTSMLFQGMLERQTWYSTRQQNDQTYNLALQNELSTVISKFNGIASAMVIIDAPERQGLGAGTRKPTASATVFAQGKNGLDQATVDAIAALIAGSKSGLTIESVRVIDGNLRRQRRATAMEDQAASTYLEDVTKWENSTREKLVNFLSYIPEVMVAVTTQIDNTRLNRTREEFLPKDSGTISLIKRERGSSQTQAGAAPGGEVGIRSNVGMDVNSGAAAAAPGNSTKEDESEFLNFPGRVQDLIIDNKGRPSMVAVSVNVPRAFVASQIPAPAAATATAAGAEANAGPTDDQLTAKFEKDIRPKIIESILPHVKAMIASANPGLSTEELNKLLTAQVSVSMIPLDVVAMSIGGGSGGAPGASGSGGSGGSSALPFGLSTAMIENAVIGGMALLAMGMMAIMVKRAGVGTTIPSPEEIVGLPPALATKNDLIGEADESDAPMMGIEVDDAEVRNTKMLDQVTDWVKGSPEGAAKLLNRWIATEP